VRRSCEIDASRALRLLACLATDAVDEPGDDHSDTQHDRERQQVLGVVHREGALRRDEQHVECGDTQDRRGDRSAARPVERDQHDGEQIHHRDVDEVETPAHRVSGERGSRGGSDRPCIPGPRVVHDVMMRRNRIKSP
jgi:hypothetical protein